MKKLILFMAMCLLMASCTITDEEYQEKKAEYNRLTEQCQSLSNRKSGLNSTISQLEAEIRDLRTEKNILQNGRTSKYIVKFQIKQGTFTLDPWDHIKNSMNTIEIEIPVDREYYNALSLNQDLTDAFKWGSLIMDGDFSNLHMRVVGKRIE